jgi:hypothetical protein
VEHLGQIVERLGRLWSEPVVEGEDERRLAQHLELALELPCLVPLEQLAWAVALLCQGAPLLDTLDRSGELDGLGRHTLGRLERRELLLVLLRRQIVA